MTFLLLIAVVLVLGAGLSRLAVWEPKNVGMIQYAGSLNGVSWDRPDIVKSSKASFYGYEIHTKIADVGNVYSCGENTCGGTQAGTDEYGCTLYENSGALIAKVNTGSSNQYPYVATKKTSYIAQDITCESPVKGTIITCQDGYQEFRGRNADVYIYGTKTCGGRVGTAKRGCWIKPSISYQGQTLYESEDYLAAGIEYLFPIGVREATVTKTWCSYLDTAGAFIPCIDDDGEYAPVSYCEQRYGNLVECKDVLVDQEVTVSTSDYYKRQSKFLDYRMLEIQFNQQSNYRDGSCRWVANKFEFRIPEEAFNFTVTMPDEEIVQGDSVEITLTIENNWQPVTGELIVNFEIPTDLANPSTETKRQTLTIPQGNSTVTFTRSTARTADKLYVKPTLHVLVPGSHFQGVNGRCYGQQGNDVTDLSKCEYVQIGTVWEDQKAVKVVPKTITKTVTKIVKETVTEKVDDGIPWWVEMWRWIKQKLGIDAT